MAVCSSRSRPMWLENVAFDHGMIDCLPIPACLCDRLGRAVIWNQAARWLWGGERRDDGDGRNFGGRKLCRPDGTEFIWPETPIARAIKADMAVTGAEAIVERANGGRVRCALNIIPMHDDRGMITGAMTCFQPLDRPGNIVPRVDITEQRQAEENLRRLSATLEERVQERTREIAEAMAERRDSEHRFRMLVNGIRDYAIFMLDPNGMVTNWNIGAERIKGYTEAEIVGCHFSVFYSDNDREWGAPQRALTIARTTGRFEAEGWRHRKDGSRFWANVVIDPIQDESGELIGYAKVTRDLTEKREMEDQLRQAQKMEAIGQLTGGIAHDFNNLLAVVVGNLEALKRRFGGSLGNQEALFERLTDGALSGADRAAALTRQLLAFSRQQALDPQPIDPAALIASTQELLRRSLGERIIVEASIPAEVWTAFADGHQLENALLNLAVNARDAMPMGGRLTISAGNVQIDATATRSDELTPGDYVMISVTDVGTGMLPAIAAKAFEPFFTTKVSGHGSGLGLSQVYGFSKQSGGHASIETAIGMGTTVRLYLPRFHGVPTPAELHDNATAIPLAQQDATILLVEDDDLVRACSLEILRDLGYRVIEASDGHEALRLLDSHLDVSLVFTDLGLPGGLDGEQLAAQVRLRRPEMKFLFTTGYVEAGKHPRSDPAGRTAMLSKPFNYARLGEKLRQLLEGDRG
jgi:PAS domain S-box-containing protein